MQRIISAMLAVILLCPAFCFTAAAESGTENMLEYELLSYFGINTAGEEKLTRGEWADWIAKISGAENVTSSGTYKDVQESYRYYSSIEAVSAAGYFSGKAEGIFGKDDEVTYLQAVTPLVKLAGYDFYAATEGYIYAAGKAGFGIGCAANDVITRGQAAKICAKALKTKIMLTGFSGGKTELSGDTVLSRYHNIYKGRGIMTANEYTDIYSERGYRAAEVGIDKVKYICENADYDDFIAREIDYYYIDGENDDPTLAAATVSKHTKTLEIKASRKNSFADGKFTYERENGKRKTIDVAKGYDLIINNGTVFTADDANLLFEEGELVFIDNNSDGKYESIVARRAESFVIGGVDPFSEVIYYDGGSIRTDNLDQEKFSVFYDVDTDGNIEQIGIDYLKKDMVMTVFRSENQNYIEAYQTDSSISGVLTQLDDDYLYIDDEMCEYVKSAVLGFTIGTDVIAYTDMLGYVVKIEEDSPEYRYGYLFRILVDSTEDSAKFKIFTTEQLEMIETDEKLFVDGKRCEIDALTSSDALFENGKAKKQVVRYKLKKGKLRSIDTEKTESGGEDDKLNCEVLKRTLTYYPGFPMVGGNVKITDKTLFLAVPTLADETDDEDCYTYSYNFKGYPSAYSFSVYDVDDKLSAGAVLLHPAGSMKGDDATEVTSRVGIVYKITSAVNDDDEPVKKITLYTENDKLETFYTKEGRCKNFNAKFGTVVEYVLSDGEISGIKAEVSPGEEPQEASETSTPSNSEYVYKFGRVKDVFDTYFTVISNSGNSQYNSALENMWISPVSAEKYFVVDLSQKKINTGSSVNLYSGAYVLIRNFRGYRNLHFVIFKY
mgnify:CR=1 FL=1